MEWMSGVNFLEAAICVTDNVSAYVGRGYPCKCMKSMDGIDTRKVRRGSE